MKSDLNARVPGPKRTAVVLGGLFILDLGYSGQELLSLLVAAFGLALLTAGAAWSALRGAAPLARSRALRAALYLALGAATLTTIRLNAATAEAHAANVIQACRAFERRHGALPDRLDETGPGVSACGAAREVQPGVGSIHVRQFAGQAPHVDVRGAAGVRPADLQLRGSPMESARLARRLPTGRSGKAAAWGGAR